MSPGRQPYDPKRFNVYVIGLNRAVLKVPRFAQENLQHNPTKPCVSTRLRECSLSSQLNDSDGKRASLNWKLSILLNWKLSNSAANRF